MRAKDVMSDGVMSVAADATLLEAAKLLVNCRVSAMPVVDRAGIMIGILSEADLLRPAGDGRPQLLDRAARDPDGAADDMKAGTRKVADVMTGEVVSAGEDTPLAQLARLMTDHAVKRLPILRDGSVVGIVSRADLLRGLIALESGPDGDVKFSRDEQLRREVSAACRGRSWSLAQRLDVVVSRGVAHLWGIAPSELVRKAYRAAAENVPGIKAVEVHMHIVPPQATRVGL
jgi:CBS-domain-containing membrane protein